MDMKVFSINDISELYGVKVNSVQKALQRKVLKGHKNDFGEWLVKEKDAEEYYTPPAIPEWIKMSDAAILFSITPMNLRNAIDEGMKSMKYKGEWYLLSKDFHKFLRKQPEGSINMNNPEAFPSSGEFTVLNLFGSYSPQLAA